MTFVFKNKQIFYRIIEAINETYFMFWFDDKNNSITVNHPKAIAQIKEYCDMHHVAVKEVI